MERYERLAVLTAMIHDETKGTVEPRGDFGVSIDYWPEASDRRELAFGLWASAKLLFAAGARRVLIPASEPRVIERGESFEDLKERDIERGQFDITAVHPMASVPMGSDPAQSAVDDEGRYRGIKGLWIADGSLFPSSVGIPPQLSIYALGLRVGRAIGSG